MKDKRREKRENGREDEREDERDQEKWKRDRDERKDVFSRKMFENPQTRQMNKLNMFRKNPSRTNYSSFFLGKFILPCFELFTWFEFVFRAGGIISEDISVGTVTVCVGPRRTAPSITS